MATQNPIEQEGTYPLPDAQVDRFMFKLVLDYPDREDELIILRRMARSAPLLQAAPVISAEDILELRRLVDEIHMEPRIEEYIVSLVDATRRPERYRLRLGDLVRYGASPRAVVALALTSKGAALMAGRAFVLPEDVKAVAMDVLRHRVIPSYEAEAQQKSAADLVSQILAGVPVP
jgi:MoxR-like ATPase